MNPQNTWIFGYGSLIWRPDFPYIEQSRARLNGWKRRFWQGSHDHRGTPDAPGRVVTLVPDGAYHCDGVAYLVSPEIISETFEVLDYREKNGYERHLISLHLIDQRVVPGVVYIAARDNFAYLGDASLEDITTQISNSHGPSGHNTEYALELAKALRHWQIDDEHVFSVADRLKPTS